MAYAEGVQEDGNRAISLATFEMSVMLGQISESDWKIFKPVREKARERFCERVLIEAERIRSDVSKSQHERYIAIYQLLKERDKELELAFDYLRRSTALVQLANFRSLGLVTDAEYIRFSAPTREIVDRFVDARRS